MIFHTFAKKLDIEIDTLYDIQRSNKLYQTLPQALFFSPLMVLISILTLLLPLSGVFAPGSLIVTIKNYTNTLPCIIPTGNLNSTEVELFSSVNSGGIFAWGGVLPQVTTLTIQWFIEQRIPDLPQVCGLNCLYTVSVPSFVFECQPDPVSLPYGQLDSTTLWNATLDPNLSYAFYVAWMNVKEATEHSRGSAHCLAVLAQYEVEVGEIVPFLQSHL
jgi:hypothetical protein